MLCCVKQKLTVIPSTNPRPACWAFGVALFVFGSCPIASFVNAMPASPHPYSVTQPDGTIVTMRIRGDEFFHWEEDAAGYTVMRDANGVVVYATLDAQSNLAPSVLKVGIDDPVAAGLKPGVLPPLEVRNQRRAQALATEENQGGAAVAAQPPAVGTVKNVVVMMRFSNHLARTLPSNANIDTIFNNPGPHTLAPTGSVRDLYLENSYGQMTLDSSVFGWVNLPQSEQTYAGGNSGLTTQFWQAIRDALTLADASINFSQFDEDGDGYVDAIAFIHSGYGAEWGGTDADGTNYTSRIWSHRWSISPDWVSNEGVRVRDYHVSPGLWGTSGSAPGRIGVIAHETGHFIGLPDLYDTDGGGEGIGSYCMMANSWGFTGDQYNPPHFSAWCKEQLGWVTPVVLNAAGTYTARRVEEFPEVYRIDSGFPGGEYLLVENRQPFGFEDTMPQGGLTVWHVDDGKCCNTDEGFPGQIGWPGNDRHYRVALLQADGLYQMERGGFGRGDAGDVFHDAGNSVIDGTTRPNTHAYQNGIVLATDHRIHNISASAPTMTFDFDSYVPAPGACCNDLTGECTDNEASAPCMQSGGSRFVEGGTCAALVPPCTSSIPQNDDCADAMPVFDGFTYFDTTLASTDGPRDCPGDLRVGRQDIWYLYQSTCTGTLLVSLCSGTNYDSTLQIYEGSSCAPFGPQSGCSDDDCDIGGGPSRLLVSAVQNQDYLIRIGGWQTAVGAGFAEIACSVPPPTCGAGQGDCCVLHADPGCENVSCCGAVCAVDPYCCKTGWDQTCADEALQICVTGLCDPADSIVWDPDPLSPDRTTRSLRFRVQPPAAATGTPGLGAIQVTMVDLQNPTPPNVPQYPPRNFACWEAGTACGTVIPASPPAGACTGTGEDMTPDAAGGFQGGCARWVGKPGTFMESQGPPATGPFRAARLQCTPFYHDWVTETAGGTIAVVGAEIVPSSEYSVQAYASSCKGAEGGCTNVSAPVQMLTRRSGDVASLFSPPELSGQPNSIDVTRMVDKFKGAPGAPVKAISQLQPNLPELNADVGALDIVAAVDAVKELAYAPSGPCPCPSQATCNALACSTPGTCTGSALPGLGAGAMCVLTCSGGDNAGEPCINDTHCPGGGACGSGSCRDRCGRCKP